MAFDKPLKSILYLVISGLTLWVLGALTPKIINVMDDGAEKIVLTAILWISYFLIIATPQYFIFATNIEVSILFPIKSCLTLATATLGGVIFASVLNKFVAALPLSTWAENFFYFIYWILFILLLYVPQHLLYEQEVGAE